MTLLAPDAMEGSRRVYQVQRRRASIRAGEFPLTSLFAQLGIEWDWQRPPIRASIGLEVYR